MSARVPVVDRRELDRREEQFDHYNGEDGSSSGGGSSWFFRRNGLYLDKPIPAHMRAKDQRARAIAGSTPRISAAELQELQRLEQEAEQATVSAELAIESYHGEKAKTAD